MKYVHLTWYVLADGTHADPNDVSPDDKGVLRHKNGVEVALRESGVPQTVGRDAAENGNRLAASQGGVGPLSPEEVRALMAENPPLSPQEVRKRTAAEAKDMKPEEPKRGYKTRESKAG